MNISLYDISVWVLPLVFAITFHEAAHGFVAHRLGDNTAYELGRVSFNPLKHIDPFGTVILPAHPAAVALAVPVRLCQAGAGELPQTEPPAARYGLGGAGGSCHQHRPGFGRRSSRSTPFAWRRRMRRNGWPTTSKTR